MAHTAQPTTYGLMAEFDNPTALVDAATKARLAGYRKMDAFSPIPIEELNEALDLKRTRLPLLVLLGGILGGFAGFSLEYWVSVIAYPMNVGDRPPEPRGLRMRQWSGSMSVGRVCADVGTAKPQQSTATVIPSVHASDLASSLVRDPSRVRSG